MSEGRLRADGPAAAEPIHPRPPTPLPPEERKERRTSELTRRLLTASVLVPGLLFLIAEGGLFVLGAVVVIILLGLKEFYRLIEEKGAHPLATYGLVGGALLPVVAYVGNEYHATILMTATLLGVMVAQLRKPQIGEALASVSGTFFGVFYVGWLLSHTVVLREFERMATAKWPSAATLGLHPDVGAFFLVFTLAAVVLCDTGAYFAGKAWGRRKLAPTISPGKTVEGAVGGILAGTAGGLAFKAGFDFLWPELSTPFPWSAAGPFAATISLAGMIGDLVESVLKRDAAIKDAGSLLPGMGGVLDRIDSSLLGIPVMYYMLLGWVYLQVAP